jgi:hypothetical protein
MKDQDFEVVEWPHSSVDAQNFSILAVFEVACSSLIYWLLAVYYNSITILVVSACVAPLLLLRSDRSVRRGIALFERYVDSVIWQSAPGETRYWSLSFVFSTLLAISTIAGFVLVLSYIVLSVGPVIHPILAGLMIGYIAIVFSLATIAALAATQLIVVAENVGKALIVACCVVLTAILATLFSAESKASSLATIASCLVLSSIGLYSAPRVLRHGRILAAQLGAPNVTSLTALRALMEGAPKVCLVLTVGVFLGGWLRSVCTRFIATMQFLPDGLRALPSNWWRTLFVQDIKMLPEVIPGYSRDDIINTNFVARYIGQLPHPNGTFICSISSYSYFQHTRIGCALSRRFGCTPPWFM